MPVNERDTLHYDGPRVAQTSFCNSKERIKTSRARCPLLRDRIILEKHFTVYHLKKSALVFLKKHLVDLENKSIHEKYEQKFSLFLKPRFRETKIPPPLQHHNATLPSN